MKQNIIAELSYKLIEDESSISFDLSHKGEIKDYLTIALRLSETRKGRLALSILDAIEAYTKEEVEMEESLI
ncbi:hypothetical protein ABIB40_001908 [Pedobacter sp. UYP30]|uniref:hypothetical protein n=1 Tax=Pedobacter sp. UYP30 TaxID=1756400 RepID=UPI0033976F65